MTPSESYSPMMLNAMPVRLGKLSLTVPRRAAERNYNNSKEMALSPFLTALVGALLGPMGSDSGSNER